MSRNLFLTRENQCNHGIEIDHTFFARLLYFADYVGKNYGAGDFLIDQEWEYIKSISEKCVEFQKETATEQEKSYFENLQK